MLSFLATIISKDQRLLSLFPFPFFLGGGNGELGREKRGLLGQVGTFDVLVPASADDPACNLAGYVSPFSAPTSLAVIRTNSLLRRGHNTSL